MYENGSDNFCLLILNCGGAEMYSSNKRCLFPMLTENLVCDVLVVGGGAVGLLCAFKLCECGFNVAVVEKDLIASGKTSYNLGVVFSHERSFCENEIRAKDYSDSFERIKEISKTVGDLSYRSVKSLFYTEDSSYKGLSEMRNEYQRHFFYGEKCSFLTWKDAMRLYSFNISAGILTESSAQFDPVFFCEKIADHISLFSGNVFENTEIVSIDKENNDGSFSSVASNGCIVSSRVVVDCRNLYVKGEDLYTFSSYYFISKPISKFVGWSEGSIISDDCKNRLYIRHNGENRMVSVFHSFSIFRKLGTVYDNYIYNYCENLLKSMFWGITDLSFETVGKYEFCLPKRNVVDNNTSGLYRVRCNDTIGFQNAEILAEKVCASVSEFLSDKR